MKNSKNKPEAVLNHIENICEENLTSILSQYDGNICDLARRLYAENFGDIIFYPWCKKCFDEDDPETYCTGIEVEATFFFDITDIGDNAICGTVLVTVHLHEDGSLHDVCVNKASTNIN